MLLLFSWMIWTMVILHPMAASPIMPQTSLNSHKKAQLANYYTTQAVCSDSRAALLTGLFANRIGVPSTLFLFNYIALKRDKETN